MKKVLIPILLAALLGTFGLYAYRASVVAKLKDAIRAPLADPDAALFRNVRLRSDWSQAGSMICGEMNARNLLGGYNGYQRFAVTSVSYHVIADDELVDGMCSVMDDGTIPWWYLGQGGSLAK